jgi:hypothetical protein
MDVFDLLKAGGAVGALIGLIPLLYGFFHALGRYGFLGWLACTAGGMAGLAVNTAFSAIAAFVIAGLSVFYLSRLARGET